MTDNENPCGCRCHAYGPGSHVTCDRGNELPQGGYSCSPCNPPSASDEGRMGPCAFPRCRDQDGNPRLTRETFCSSCQRHYRRLLDWIVLDYATLKSDLPSPSRMGDDGSSHRSAKAKSFGHPAEWASVTCSEIASALNWAEDGLRDELAHEPAIHPFAGEAIRVAHGFKYLVDQFQRLCSYSAAADTAVELSDLHGKIRSTLGYTRVTQRLPTPCPWCDVAALVRDVGQIVCRNQDCGHVIDEVHYEWLAGWIVDRVIEEYDTRKAEQVA